MASAKSWSGLVKAGNSAADLGDRPLLVDANGFIKSTLLSQSRLPSDASSIVTLQGVIDLEVRDEVSREAMKNSVIPVQTVAADKESINFVTEFSKKTGDYLALMKAGSQGAAMDIPLLAAAVMLEKRLNGEESVRTEPKTATFVAKEKKRDAGTASDSQEQNSSHPDSSAMSAPSEDSDGFVTVSHKKQRSRGRRQKDGAGSMPGWSAGDQDEEGWVGPEDSAESGSADSKDLLLNADETNLPVSEGAQQGGLLQLRGKGATLLTDDRAMQNVALQLGIPVMGVDGREVTGLKQFVLKCHACFKICHDVTKEFCPWCGGHTMMKISMSIDQKGRVHYSKGIKNFNLRGTQFSMKKPKGGQKCDDIILREDQLLGQRKQRKATMDEMYDLSQGGLGTRKASNKSVLKYGHNKRNPNERAHR